jgi:hypothetical protein
MCMRGLGDKATTKETLYQFVNTEDILLMVWDYKRNEVILLKLF